MTNHSQTLEAASNSTARKYEGLLKEVQENRDSFTHEKQDLERRLRAAEAQGSTWREETNEVRGELSSLERRSKHDLSGLDAKHETLKRTLESVQREREEKSRALETTQQKLAERDIVAAGLESEVMRLEAQVDDADTLALIKRELSDQVAHITKLEATNTSQFIELKQLRRQQKSIEVVQEEKRMLEGKIRLMNDLRKELSEAQLQRQILEDERTSWTSYLEDLGRQDGDIKFDNPQELAQAFMQACTEKAFLTNRIGELSTEATTSGQKCKELEDRIASLQDEAAQAKTQAAPDGADARTRARLERQRTLANKEIEYLRAQVKAFEAEEAEFAPERHDEARASQMQDFEKLVNGYRDEVDALRAELEKPAVNLDTASAGSKRPREGDDDDERVGEMTRKLRAQQDTISQMTTAESILRKEVEAQKSQLSSLHAKSRTRVLELRSNPTADAEALKMSTLKALRLENTALLAQLEGRDDVDTVPVAALDRLREEVVAQKGEVAFRDKRIQRLRETFVSKTNEFREAIASMLGWKVDFLPNGRVRVSSIFNPPTADDPDGNSIMFDGEAGTMKCSGGSRSAFADELRENIEFWVEGRGEIPCFLAACSLEFYDKSTRATKPS